MTLTAEEAQTYLRNLFLKNRSIFDVVPDGDIVVTLYSAPGYPPDAMIESSTSEFTVFLISDLEDRGYWHDKIRTDEQEILCEALKHLRFKGRDFKRIRIPAPTSHELAVALSSNG